MFGNFPTKIPAKQFPQICAKKMKKKTAHCKNLSSVFIQTDLNHDVISYHVVIWGSILDHSNSTSNNRFIHLV
jgi:hypothetical protein